MSYKEKYNKWLDFDEDTRDELLSISDENEIKDRFYKDLEFGTGGLRGIMGAGSNRMNTYTVRKATYGLANYLIENFDDDRSVVIAYDSRNNSYEFAREAALVFCACGIKSHIFDTLMPTPVLSYSVKHLSCSAGIVITASHNPKEYNGYKVYDHNGCQLVPRYANEVIKYVNTVEDYENIPTMNEGEAKSLGLLNIIGSEVVESFLNQVKKQSIYKAASSLRVVYTPLHGTGNIPVRSILKSFDVYVVKEQELPDGNFSTVKSPNPEDKAALKMAIEYAEEIRADIVLGTDPDCDRVGVAALHENEYKLLTGNQIGALLVYFVLSNKELNDKSTLVKTIVTSELGANIARKYGLHIVDTLTGFKYIGDQISLYEKTGNNEFVIGYEESYGYLVGTYARDKDAVVSSMLICEMAAFYKEQGKTLIDVLEDIYTEYGYYNDALDSFTFKGAEGSQKIKDTMLKLRSIGKKLIENIDEIKDYNEGIDGLPRENVLKYILNNGSWFAIRPSGTEPKLKVYYSIKDENREDSQIQLETIREKLNSIIES